MGCASGRRTAEAANALELGEEGGGGEEEHVALDAVRERFVARDGDQAEGEADDFQRWVVVERRWGRIRRRGGRVRHEELRVHRVDCFVGHGGQAEDAGAVVYREGRRRGVLVLVLGAQAGGRRWREVVDADVLVEQDEQVGLVEEPVARIERVWSDSLRKCEGYWGTENSRANLEGGKRTSNTSPVFQFHTRIWPGFVLADHAMRSPNITVVETTRAVWGGGRNSPGPRGSGKAANGCGTPAVVSKCTRYSATLNMLVAIETRMSAPEAIKTD